MRVREAIAPFDTAASVAKVLWSFPFFFADLPVWAALPSLRGYRG